MRPTPTVVAAILCLILVLPSGAVAQGGEVLGIGRIFTNDALGDGHDRWRTGSYQLSVIHGRGWSAAPPARPGALVELRFATQVIVPTTGDGRAPWDRPYVGALGLGLYSHSALGAAHLTAGLSATALGPGTGVSDFQRGFHDLFGLADPPGLADQVGDAVIPGAAVEIALPVPVTGGLTLRPYAELRRGPEDLARAGIDAIWGPLAQDDLLVRDEVTGHLVRAAVAPGRDRGWALVAGGDWTRLDDSAWFPRDRPARAEAERLRLRAGAHLGLARGISAFYGLTWMSEEFVGQPEPQVVGSLRIGVDF
ncbi:lipid A-modifier LpxR family protein [Wenxinia saemankumensis]|uniref:Outer membrane protein n=1 Tax=Wenxinia saemankumensis TaxID=1447782 RepID=A0A1M6BTE7_9RHOB|nr:lipid A-modifier LpxR family protein [Wenxinia saemankumensis]SHI51961.1 hypothetical protein SAMN05444417_0838 [Wenxinia saemankumensis]